jgi:outer membrane protein assembly factor BamB
LTRRKVATIIIISFVFLFAVFFGFYFFTDIVVKPPQNVNSDSLPGEWAMFRHDLSHTGTTNPSDIVPQGKLKWVFPTGAPIHSSPAAVDGIVCIGSQDSKLYALNASTGAKQWEYKAGSWVESSPVIVNGIVYFGANDGRLRALDVHSGEELWNFEAKYFIKSSPAVADGVIYFGAGDYYLYALDAVKGKKLWDFETEGCVDSSPAVANGIVYIGSQSKFFYALHALDGRRRLRFMSFYPVFSSPAVKDGTVYFIDSYAQLYAVDGNARNWPLEHRIRPFWIQLWAFGLPLPDPPPHSGLIWNLRIGKRSNSSPVVTDDSVYVGSDNKLVALDIRSFQKRWEFEAKGIISSSPALSGATLYVGSEDGRLYAVDAATGEKLWDFLTGDKITSSPAVADGTVYISSHDGNLYAIK